MLAFLRSYATDHLKTWNRYTDAVMIAYNTKVHQTTWISLFKFILSRKPPPMALESQSTLDTFPSTNDYHQKLKTWLTPLVPAARESMGQAQATYKRNFDARLREDTTALRAGDYVFVTRE